MIELLSVAEERRPTVNELANQKGVVQRASGWKLYVLASEIEDMVCTVFIVLVCNIFQQVFDSSDCGLKIVHNVWYFREAVNYIWSSLLLWF